MTVDEFCKACQALLDRGTKPVLPEVAPLLQPFYDMPGNGAGGSLHIVLDDCNNDDASVDFCIEWALSKNDPCGELFARVLRLCSKTQRAKLRVP